MLTLGEAARLTGRGKTTLTRAIQAGRLSATRRDDGGYIIDPSELARVYTVKPETVAVARSGTLDTADATRLAVAEAELRALKDMLAELQRARDSWQEIAGRLALSGPIAAPEPRRSWARWWFGLRKAG